MGAVPGTSKEPRHRVRSVARPWERSQAPGPLGREAMGGKASGGAMGAVPGTAAEPGTDGAQRRSTPLDLPSLCYSWVRSPSILALFSCCILQK
jgi:hypothetical protein